MIRDCSCKMIDIDYETDSGDDETKITKISDIRISDTRISEVSFEGLGGRGVIIEPSPPTPTSSTVKNNKRGGVKCNNGDHNCIDDYNDYNDDNNGTHEGNIVRFDSNNKNNNNTIKKHNDHDNDDDWKAEFKAVWKMQCVIRYQKNKSLVSKFNNF